MENDSQGLNLLGKKQALEDLGGRTTVVKLATNQCTKQGRGDRHTEVGAPDFRIDRLLKPLS